MQAIATHGLSKVGMKEVGECAGVSRGTVYRYFPNRDALLRELASREARRFGERVVEAVRSTPPGEQPLHVVLRYATWHVREHPVLRRLLESEPAFVLNTIREYFPSVKRAVAELVCPMLGGVSPIQQGIVTQEQFIDWLTRMMISAYLIPDANPEKMARSLTELFLYMSNSEDAPSAAAESHASAAPSAPYSGVRFPGAR